VTDNGQCVNSLLNDVQMKPVSAQFWIKTELKIVTMDTDAGIPLTH